MNDKELKQKIGDLKKKNDHILENAQKNSEKLGELSANYGKMASVASTANIIISDFDKQFSMATKLNKHDIEFLMLATAIQCIRQYVIGTLTERKNDEESAEFAHKVQEKIWNSDNNAKKIKEYRADGARYRATREEIMNSFSVPYDVTSGTKIYGVGGAVGEGIGGKTHRYKTLGHDPWFGWVFGTSNIMTNTLTNDVGKTFHVKNGKVVTYGGYDKTALMFEHVLKRTEECPLDLGLCLIKQGLHYMSDVYSYEGILLPGNVKLDDNVAKELVKYGIDTGTTIKIGAQAGMAILINRLVGMIHGMLYDPSVEVNKKLYEVRTRKILSYSNCIASASNVVAVAVGASIGVATGNSEMTKKSLNYLDIGGILVTLHRLVTDTAFIQQVQREFMEKQWYDYVMGELEG